MIKTKLFIYSPSNSPFLFFPLFIFCCLLLFCGKSFSKMSMGFNLWALGWGLETGMNQQCQYHMACLQNPICNPLNIKIDAYAVAPYWNASDHEPKGTDASMRASLADADSILVNTHRALVGSGIPLICYEGRPDNFSSTKIANEPFQYQLTLDALNDFSNRVEDIMNWYTFNGGDVWGLKMQVGDDLSISPKWRAYIQWLSTTTTSTIRRPTFFAKSA